MGIIIKVAFETMNFVWMWPDVSLIQSDLQHSCIIQNFIYCMYTVDSMNNFCFFQRSRNLFLHRHFSIHEWLFMLIEATPCLRTNSFYIYLIKSNLVEATTRLISKSDLT